MRACTYAIRKHSETATDKLPDLLKHGIHALQRREKGGRTGSAVELTGHWISNLRPGPSYISSLGRKSQQTNIRWFALPHDIAVVGFARGERVVGLFGATNPASQFPILLLPWLSFLGYRAIWGKKQSKEP